MIRPLAIVIGLLASCAPTAQPPGQPITDAPSFPDRAAPLSSSLPPVKTFAAAPVQTPQRSNTEIAQDFLDLTFRVESGRILPVMTKFDGPITVRVNGAAQPLMVNDLKQLVGRIRDEARVNIRLVSEAEANVTVEALPRAEIQKVAPTAACFVVPRVSSWREFTRNRNTSRYDWATLQNRERVAIFVPSDAPPQEIRDCLHEELAQAIGPLNDLYRLPDSVFNDDNIHNVLTSFDMLILRLYYSPALANGMSRLEVAARLPGLLRQMNPGGQTAAIRTVEYTDQTWVDELRTALSAGESPTRRRAAATRAVAFSVDRKWGGPREAFAHYALGRLHVGHNSTTAQAAFLRAEQIYRATPATYIHAAHVSVQRAAFALQQGDADQTISIVDEALPRAQQHQNAALLATLMLFKAEALALQGKTDAANALRLDSLGWARYGFGSDTAVEARLTEIAALRPD